MLTCSTTCSCGHHWEQSWALKSTQAMQALQLPCAWGRTSADAFQHRSCLRCWFRDSSAGKCACSAVTAHPEHMAALWAPAPQHLVARSCSPSSLFVLFITPFKHYSVFFLPFFFSCLWHSFLTCREMRAFAPCPSHPFSLKSQPPLTRGLHILGQCHRASGLLPKVQRAKMCTLAQTNYMLFVLHKHSHRVSCEMLWFHFLTFMGTFMHTFQWYTMFLRHMGNNKVFPWS